MGRTFSYSWSDSEEAPLGFGVYNAEQEVTSRAHYSDDPSLFGHIKTCYCGSDAIIQASSTATNPGRLFYTCSSRDDGECHIWKWWDEAMMEELLEVKRGLVEPSKHTIPINREDNNETLEMVHEMLHNTTKEIDDLKKTFKNLSLALISLGVVMLVVNLFK